MAKKKRRQEIRPAPEARTAPATGRPMAFAAVGAAVILAAAATAWLVLAEGASAPPSDPAPASAPVTAPQPSNVIETGKAQVVTLGIAYGSKVPTVAQALSQIERRSVPEDGTGRTFAVLEADGWASDGNLHLQLRISPEEPGLGQLVYKPTGSVLWNAQVVGAPAPLPEDLNIHLEGAGGEKLTVDGSTNPPSVLDATIRETGMPVKQLWADGTERVVSFVYSACGCSVQVSARREGDRLVRTSSNRRDGSERPADLPVIFPDDAAVAQIVDRLMRW